MNPYIALVFAIVSEVVATSFLTASDGFTRRGPTVAAIIGYIISFYLLSLTLRHIPTGVAYAIWSGIGTVLIALAGWTFFKQRLDAPAILGMTLIVLGVIIMQVFSTSNVKG